MMATTELDKIPDDDPVALAGLRAPDDRRRSRSPISCARIADAEEIAVDDAALMLIARAGDGSMRDAQSALDQVIAFAGADDRGRGCRDGARPRAAATCCSTSPRRWRDEDAPARVRAGRPRGRVRLRPAARLPRAVARSTRDLLVVSIDPSRVDRSGDRRRGRARAAAGAGDAVLARGPAARVRPADEGGSRHPRRRAAALSPRDGAAALDSPAQAGAADGPDSRGSRRRRRRRPRRAAGREPAAAEPRLAGTDRPRRSAGRAANAATVRSRRGTPRAGAGRAGVTAAPSTSRRRPRAPSEPAGTPARRATGRSQGRASSRRSGRRRSSSTARSSRRRSGSTSRPIASSFAFAPQHSALRVQLEQSRPWLEDDRRAARRPQDRRRRGRGRASAATAGASGQPAPKPAGPDRQIAAARSRRSPTPACRRCSTCSRRRSRTSKKM